MTIKTRNHNKQYSEILEMCLIETKRIMREESDKNLLREFGLYDLLYDNEILYEAETISSFTDELLDGTHNDWKEFKKLLVTLRKVIPRIMLKILKLGGKVALNALVASAKRAYKYGTEHPVIVRKLFYGLLLLLCMYGGYQYVKSINTTPVIPNTQIVVNTVEKDSTSIDSITVYSTWSGETEATVVSFDETTNNIVFEEVSNRSEAPVRILKPGEKKTEFYHISKSMMAALAKVEHFKPTIYDAKRPSRKITQKDMMNMALDLTIGYGHKLTKEERKKWKYNMVISEQEAMNLFKKDVQYQETIVNQKLKTLPYDSKVEYSQGFIDGFVSLLFNMGYGNMFGNARKPECEFWHRLKACRIDKKNNCINKKDLDYALSQVKRQNITQPGHKPRRAAEYAIMTQNGKKINVSLYNLKNNA